MMFSGQVLSHDDFPLSSSTTTNLIILENVYVGRYDLEEIKFFRYSEFIFRIDQVKASNLKKRDDDAIHEALVIKVWDSSNGAKLYTFEGNNALVYLVCSHSKNNTFYMFSTSCDGQIKAWLRENNGLRIIYDTPDMDDRDVTSRTLSDADRVKVKKALRGVKVEVTHRGSMRRIYRICGLTSHATRELISEQTYGLIVEHARLPCLQVGDIQRANYLPMEVCKIVEGQRYSKRRNERQITTTIISGFWSNCTKIDAHVGDINDCAFSRPGLAC